jgi:hypothetical protein
VSAARQLLETALGVARLGGWGPPGSAGPREQPGQPHDVAGALDCAAWAAGASGRDVAACVELLCAVMLAAFPARAAAAGGVLSAFYDHPQTTGGDCEHLIRLAIRAAG